MHHVHAMYQIRSHIHMNVNSAGGLLTASVNFKFALCASTTLIPSICPFLAPTIAGVTSYYRCHQNNQYFASLEHPYQEERKSDLI